MKGRQLYYLAVIYLVAFVILLFFQETVPLIMIAAITTILSFTLIPLMYFLGIRRTKADETIRASGNLYGELNDTLDVLQWRKNRELEGNVAVLEVNCDRYVITNQFLNHDVYGSLVNSGKINFLKHRLQQQVQNIFRMIKMHNQYLQTIKHILIQDVDEETRIARWLPYYKISVDYEEDLLEQIPSILQNLKMEFPDSAQPGIR